MAEIARRVEEFRQQIARERFAGGDPVVALSPDLAPEEMAARTLAAERAHALLALGDARHNPGEDLADEALRAAIGALRAWGFAAARARLDEAAERSHDPVAQQRITLFKALTRHLAALVHTPLADKLRLTLADLDEASRPLDLLDPAERLHYRDELDRLLALREAAAKGDPALRAAWVLLRAQIAMAAGQDEAALLWLLHLAAGHAAPADPYLADLLARARAGIAALLDPPGDAANAAERPDPVRPRELFNALAARLGADLGRDVVQAMNQFALTEWVAPEVANAGVARSRRQRGARGQP